MCRNVSLNHFKPSQAPGTKVIVPRAQGLSPPDPRDIVLNIRCSLDPSRGPRGKHGGHQLALVSRGQQCLALSRCAVKNGRSAYSPQQVCLENTVGRLVKRPRVQLSPCLQQPQRHLKASSQTGKERGSGGGGRGVPRCPRPLTHGAPILCSVHSSGGPMAGARGVRSSLQPRAKGAGSGCAPAWMC